MPRVKLPKTIISPLISLWAEEYQHCVCCRQNATQLICNTCKTCIETFSGSGTSGIEGCNRYENNQSFINLHPDIALRLPKLKHYDISAIGPHKSILMDLISQFKYGKKTILATSLSDILGRQILDNYTTHELPELILPVPMHILKRMARGFNQTELLGKHIGKNLQVDMSSELVSRVHYARSQVGKSGQQRRKMTEGLFKVNQTEKLKQLSHITLLDDVITTGSTILQLIQVIKKVNPDIKIDLWCLSVSVR